MVNFLTIGQEIFRDYIRSALIIDDHWPEYEVVLGDDPAPAEDLLAEVSEGNELLEVEADLTSQAAMSPAPPLIDDDVDAQLLGGLRRALMRRGILTCGLRYQQTDRELAINLARRADIVVLDWHLVGDDGAEALEILEQLQGDCLRFVCIWTGHGRAGEVKERLIQTLGDSTKEQSIGEPGAGDLRLGNLIIAIRIKHALEDEPDLAVGPERFFEVAVEGLSNSFGGLVQLAMLEMTNRHREHLPEILEHIGNTIDIAVLLEAGDEDSPVGPGGALLAVIVDEWRSRLERDSAQLKALSIEGRRAFGAELEGLRSGDWSERVQEVFVSLGMKSDTAKRYCEILSDKITPWLEHGCEEQLPEAKGVSPRMAGWAALTSILHRDIGIDPLLRLDALLHQQFNLPESLTQGTVVKIQRSGIDHYLLCTTPLCDADRPENIGKLFTFVRSRQVPIDSVLRGAGADNYCVLRYADQWLCLALLIKERISLEVEKPQFNKVHIVHARPSFGWAGEGAVLANDSLELHRVAQLRLEHALSLAAASAAEASRIGVNKVELIRTRIRRK